MSTSKLIVRGSICRVTNFLLTVAIGFFLMPFIVHSLGSKMYGMWALVGTFLNYFTLLDLGISSAIQRFVSQSLGKIDTRTMNVVITTALFLFSILGLIFILFSILAAWIGPRFISNLDDAWLFGKIILIMGLGMGLSFPGRVFEGVVAAHLRQDILSIIWIFTLLTRTLFIVVFLNGGKGILALAMISSLATLLRFILIFGINRKLYPYIKIRFQFFHRGEIRRLLSYSIFTFLNRIGDFFRFHLDNFLIGMFLGLAPITIYAIPVRLLDYFTSLVLSSVGFVAPLFSKYEAEGNMTLLTKRFLDITKISVMLTTFVGSSMLFYGKEFISRWMGAGFERSYAVLLILGIPATIALMQNPGIGLLYGISKHHYYTVANTCEGICNLILSLVLVRKYGLYGVALGTAIPMVIFKLMIQPVYTCRSISISLLKYYRLILFTILKTFVPIFVYFIFVRNLLEPAYASMIPIWIVQTTIFIPIALFLILNGEERRLIRRAITVA